MAIINWEDYGLRKNPFDTLPLLEGGDLPLEKAFVGRDEEKKYLNELFSSDSHANIVVCGNVGSGKTSLVSFHKYFWKYNQKERPLFSSRREIEATASVLNKKSFLLEIIGSVLREVQLIEPKLVKNNVLLSKLHTLLDITQTISLSGGISLAGFGGDIGRDVAINQPYHLTESVIEQYFHSLIEWIKANKIADIQFQGLIVHMNNFDVVYESDPSLVKKFFQEIRDVLQTQDVYFIFIGPKKFYDESIRKFSRVHSVFHRDPILLSPLSKHEILEALKERMEILKSEKVKSYIRPFEDNVIFALYDLFEGDTRSILSSLKDILSRSSSLLPRPLSADEAMFLLGKERWNRVTLKKLTNDQLEILKYIALQSRPITQAEVAKDCKKQLSNISSYYFKPLKNLGILEEKEKIGKKKYWSLTSEYAPLHKMMKLQQKVENAAKEKSQQMALPFSS